MESNPIGHLRSKVRALFTLEDKLPNEEKAKHQWQLLTQVSGLNLLVGKGGVNTAFYVIGDNERKICYPDELLAMLDNMARAKFAVYKVMRTREDIAGVYSTLKEAKASKPIKGFFIIGVTQDSKHRKLYYAASGLVNGTWAAY